MKSNGTVWATGENEYGQLGIGSTTDQSLYKLLVLAM
ncbi:MAG: hypothetical protein ACUVRD_09300 [Bacteroidia bacterium]